MSLYEYTPDTPQQVIDADIKKIHHDGGGKISLSDGVFNQRWDLGSLESRPVIMEGQGQSGTHYGDSQGGTLLTRSDSFIVNIIGSDRGVIRDLTITGKSGCKSGLLMGRSNKGINGQFHGNRTQVNKIRVDGYYNVAALWNASHEISSFIDCDFLNKQNNVPVAFITARKANSPIPYEPEPEVADVTQVMTSFQRCTFSKWKGWQGDCLVIGDLVTCLGLDRCYFTCSDGGTMCRFIGKTERSCIDFLGCEWETPHLTTAGVNAIGLDDGCLVKHMTVKGGYFAYKRFDRDHGDIYGPNAHLWFSDIENKRSLGGGIVLKSARGCKIDYMGNVSGLSKATKGSNILKMWSGHQYVNGDVLLIQGKQAIETVRVLAVNGNDISLTNPLVYTHPIGTTVTHRRVDIKSMTDGTRSTSVFPIG